MAEEFTPDPDPPKQPAAPPAPPAPPTPPAPPPAPVPATVTVRCKFPVDHFDTGIEGVPVIEATGTEVPGSSLPAIEKAARKSGIALRIEEN